MKIVFLSRLFNPHIGGVENHVIGISKLLQTNNQITIVTEQFIDDLGLKETWKGITIFRIPVANVSEKQKKWVIWKWMKVNSNILEQADIIHVHDVVFWLYPFKVTHPLKKIFATFHGWEGSYPLPLKNILQRKIDTSITSGNIAVGNYINKWYGMKSKYITFGAVNNVTQIVVKKNKQPKLLYLGRLEEGTGWRECINKYHRLKPKLNWTLFVAGDGPLKHLAPSGAKLLGMVSNPFKHIQSADYVFTTGYMGILESFVCGKVVLSHYENPLKKDYLLTHPMAKFITLDDNLTTRLPRQPQLWAKDQTWKNLVNQYLRLWEG